MTGSRKNLNDMQSITKDRISKEGMMYLFEKNFGRICQNDTKPISEIRGKALSSFRELGFPNKRMEEWKNTDLTESLGKIYDYNFDPVSGVAGKNIFQCRLLKSGYHCTYNKGQRCRFHGKYIIVAL